MTTGQRIKEARKKAGLTQKGLAEKLGITYQTLAQWENDLRNPKRETLRRLANALHVTIPYFDGMDDINALDIDEALKKGDLRTAEKLMGLPIGTLEEPNPGYSYSDMEKCLIFSFSNLNEEGQKEAVKRVDELTRLDEYCHPNAVRLIDFADIDTHAEHDLQPPTEAPQSPLDSTEGTDTTPPPEGVEGAQEGGETG